MTFLRYCFVALCAAVLLVLTWVLWQHPRVYVSEEEFKRCSALPWINESGLCR